MYVDNFWIIVALIWIIYLLWRVWKLKRIQQWIIDATNRYEGKNRNLDRSLCNILIYYDAVFLRKVQAKTREKILKEQANMLRIAFTDNTFDEYITMDGKIIPMDNPIELLSNALDRQILQSDDYLEVNEDIADMLESRMEDTDI